MEPRRVARARFATSTRAASGSRRGEARADRGARDPARVEGRLDLAATRRAKLQATGFDAAGRKQYLYHPDFRAQQEQAKYDRLIRFARALCRRCALRWRSISTTSELDRERVSAVALAADRSRLVPRRLRALRAATETYGVTTLLQGARARARTPRRALVSAAKHGIHVRTDARGRGARRLRSRSCSRSARRRASSGTSGRAACTTSRARG